MNNNQKRESSDIKNDFLQIQIKQMLYRIQKRLFANSNQTDVILDPEATTEQN